MQAGSRTRLFPFVMQTIETNAGDFLAEYLPPDMQQVSKGRRRIYGMREKRQKLNVETVGAAMGGAIRCAHRKVITRINGEGGYFIRCLDCTLDGAPHETVTDAFLHRREDLEDAAALRMAARKKESGTM